MKHLFFMLIVVELLACSSPTENSTHTYYDIKGLFERQIQQLSKQKPTVLKTVDGETKQKKIEDWERELAFFLEADLNKPAFMKSYTIDSSDSLIRYGLKTQEKHPVKMLALRLNHGKVVDVMIDVEEENYLYHTQKHLMAHFSGDYLSEYQINGTQQLVGGNPKPYNIAAKIQ